MTREERETIIIVTSTLLGLLAGVLWLGPWLYRVTHPDQFDWRPPPAVEQEERGPGPLDDLIGPQGAGG